MLGKNVHHVVSDLLVLTDTYSFSINNGRSLDYNFTRCTVNPIATAITEAI